jgi:tRNA1(Val) A37 N6-methylase TrmN6
MQFTARRHHAAAHHRTGAAMASWLQELTAVLLVDGMMCALSPGAALLNIYALMIPWS